jgi:hypothetical protein
LVSFDFTSWRGVESGDYPKRGDGIKHAKQSLTLSLHLLAIINVLWLRGWAGSQDISNKDKNKNIKYIKILSEETRLELATLGFGILRSTD